MAIVKLWTATPTSNPTRFDGEGLIWASPVGIHYTGYDQYVWELEVELPEDSLADNYVCSHYCGELNGGWGVYRSLEHLEGEYVFWKKAIKSRRLLTEEEVLNTQPPDPDSPLWVESSDIDFESDWA